MRTGTGPPATPERMRPKAPRKRRSMHWRETPHDIPIASVDRPHSHSPRMRCIW